MKEHNSDVYIFLGTSAEFIKLLPVIGELQKRRISYRLVFSGQTEVDLHEFKGIIGKQNIYFSFRSKGNRISPFHFLTWTIKTLINGLFWSQKEFSGKDNSHKIFLIQGDTVTALIGAFIARLSGIKLVHVEAGLRSHNFFEPFPEEICRTLISYFADINFCSSNLACKNIAERKGKKINLKWNTSIEAIYNALKIKTKLKLPLKKPYFILILHRQEHLNFRKNDSKKIIETVINNTSDNLKCLFLAHKVTTRFLKNCGLANKIYENKNIKVVHHLPYLQFAQVLKDSEFILTDGGGNHTESYFLGKPCLILRKNVEQNEGLGKNVILSKEDPVIINSFIRNYKSYRRAKQKVSIWPSKIIVDEIIKSIEK